jgi:hypothetical protein
VFAIPTFGYALALLICGDGLSYRLSAGVIAGYALAYCLPWRVPRDDRTPFGYWFETLVCGLPLAAGTAGWLVLAPYDAGARLPDSRLVGWPPLWFAVAILAGLGIVRASGLDIGALRNGDLAFLAGPLPRHRAAARTWTVVVAVVAEEVFFRGVPAGLPSWAPMMGIAAVAFVTGHHMVRGTQDRLRWRTVGNEAGAALLLGGLVVLSGSIWPAVVAHAIANVPQLTLDFQRAKSE